MPAPSSYRIRVNQAALRRGEDAAVRAQLRILRATRRDILAALVDAGAFDRWRLTQLLAVIDREIARGVLLAQAAAVGPVQAGGTLGLDLLRVMLGPSGAAGIVGTSHQLIDAVIEVTRDQVRDVWRELGSGLKSTIRRAALGVQDPLSAMRALARTIRDPKTFGRALWRAEAIVRTEVGRAYQIAGQGELERAAEAGVKVRKYWLTAEDERVREEHQAAGDEYGLGDAIPWDEPFVVGGESLMFPKDPNGSAGNTINCRCASVPVVED
jgi:hypothetical protein